MDSQAERIQARATAKLCIAAPWSSASTGTVVEIANGRVRLDRTVAYPESGGQEGDRGVLIGAADVDVPFVDTVREPGRVLFLPGFSGVQVDAPIHHVLAEPHANTLHVGERVEVRLDVARRARLTLSHSASHLLFLAVEAVRPGTTAGVIGCHIREDQARFDFSVPARFTEDELARIEEVANSLVARDLPIAVEPHPDEPQALYWRCDGHVIPCGGTHLERTGCIGTLRVSRRSIGKGKERLSCVFPEARAPTHRYAAMPV